MRLLKTRWLRAAKLAARRAGAFLGVLGLLAASLGGCQPIGQNGNGNTNTNASTGDHTLGPPADNLVEVPDPLSGDNPRYPLLSTARPAGGESISDTRLGTTQTRVVQTFGLRHEYSRHDPFNADGSLILLLHLSDGEWRLYRTTTIPYDTDANFVRTVGVEEPRWDENDPDTLWGLREFQIVTLNVGTGVETAVKDFAADATVAPFLAANADVYRITMRDEGEASQGFRYWALLLQGTADGYRARALLTWDRQANQVIGLRELSAGESSIDWVGMSTLGTWVLIGGDYDNAAPFAGLTLANRELTDFHRLDYGIAHSDVGLDTTGREVIVMQNSQTDYVDMIPLDLGTQPILEAGGSYEGTGRVPLVRLYVDNASPIGLQSGVHISCNHAGFCVVSTFTEPGADEQNWLDRTLTLVRLDPAGPRAFYLAKVYGTAGAYWEETQASISRDGSRIVWASNWNQNVGQERVWVLQMQLSTAWLISLGN